MRIGIRREDKSQWEARIPIVPEHIEELRRQGFEVYVQPSNQRIFSDQDLRSAGAVVQDSLAECPFILGVKEIPLDVFEPRKTYFFFSHTIKAQPYNMPMLARMMARGCSLIDYERIVDDEGRRLVSFSRFAGLAGMIDTLWIFGRRLAGQGVPTPLTELKQALHYDSLRDARHHIAEVARRCRQNPNFRLTLALTGMGRVARGALEIARELEPKVLSPDSLPSLGDMPGFNLCLFDVPDMVERKAGGEVDGQEYRLHPDRYRSRFSEHVDHLDVLVNGIYWEDRFPRLLSRSDVADMFARGTPRLQVIGDISCDIEGSIEITTRACHPGAPSYVYRPDSGECVDGVEGRGIVVMATDILPTELPREASKAFSEALMELLPPVRGLDTDQPAADWGLPPELRRAMILADGELTDEYRYLAEPASASA
ncbi:MAG: hypothetical protein AAFU79_02120 [Myxococcota bacterium]